MFWTTLFIHTAVWLYLSCKPRNSFLTPSIVALCRMHVVLQWSPAFQNRTSCSLLRCTFCKTIASCVAYGVGTEPWGTSAGTTTLLRVQIVRGYESGLCGSQESGPFMSAGPSGILTSQHGYGSQFTGTGLRVPSTRWWQRIGLSTVFWIIKKWPILIGGTVILN